MFFLPGYAPELNPDELLKDDVKRAVGRRGRAIAMPCRCSLCRSLIKC